MIKSYFKQILFVILFTVAVSIPSVNALASLDVLTGAKSAALGGAYSAISGDVESLWYNPAGIAELPYMSIMFSHIISIGDINYEYLAFGMPIGKSLAWGASINYSYSQDNSYDESALPGETFKTTNLIFLAGLAMNFDWFDIGLSLKIINESIASQSQTGYALDAGFIAHIIESYLDMGLTLRDFEGKVTNSSNLVSTPADISIQIGIAEKKLLQGLLLTQEYSYYPEYKINIFSLGVQETIDINNAQLDLRAGYDIRANQIDTGTGISAGMGIRFNGFAIDYCFTPYSFAGNTHRFSLGYFFI
ncbi:MAG: PorV/PorQ family protein [bacterium]